MRRDGAREVAGVVLAAGRSARMGSVNKLLVPVEGEPMVTRPVRAALQSGLSPVVVVIPPQASSLRRILSGLPVTLVENPRAEDGLGTSLAAGLAALPDSIRGAMIFLGDMPWVSPEHVGRLLDAFAPLGRAVCVPVFEGRRGNPVLWSSAFFPAMRRLEGDRGARGLMDDEPDLVHEVEMEDDGVLRDVDTPEDLARA